MMCFLRCPRHPTLTVCSPGAGSTSFPENWSAKLWAMEFQHLLPRHGPVPSPTWISPQE